MNLREDANLPRNPAPPMAGRGPVDDHATAHPQDPAPDLGPGPPPMPPATTGPAPASDPHPVPSPVPILPVLAQHSRTVVSVSPAAQTGHGLPKGLPATLVKAAVRAGRDESVELILDPVELGRVRFALAAAGDQVQVTLQIERPETLDLLRRHADELRQEFRAAGFSGASLSFGRWGQGQKPDQTPEQSLNLPDLDVGAEPPSPPLRSVWSTELDLRL